MLRARLFHRPRRLLLASAAATVILDAEASRNELSIYPPPEPEVLLVEEPLPFEGQINTVRRAVASTFQDAYAHVHGYVSHWISIEHAVETRVKSLVSPSESLTPGILYVGVATLSGSIIARNRTLATRLLLPSTLFIASMHHFLPKTTHNVSVYLNSLEAEYLPTLAEKHRIGREHTRMTLERIKDGTKSGREKLNQGVESFVDRIQDFTELKIREGLGWGPKRDAQTPDGISKKDSTSGR